jgi:hypothetical protein
MVLPIVTGRVQLGLNPSSSALQKLFDAMTRSTPRFTVGQYRRQLYVLQ